MADIVVTTDFSQVNNLNNSLKATDGLFVKVVDSILREEARARRITKKFAKTTEENLAIIAQAEAVVAEKMQIAADKREKARQREAARAEKEAARIAAALKKQADAEAKLAEEVAKNRAISAQRSTAALNQRLGVTGSPATASGAGFSAMEAEVERLRLKYDQIYASSQLYESSLNELNRVHMLGITSTKQHEAAVESLNAEYQAFQNGVARVGNRFAEYNNIMQQSQKGLARYGVVMQQTGYQVGDFLVQVQSGTNAFVAFGQQATQLAGLLTMSMNPKIVALGAALSIVIPLVTAVAAAFMRTAEDSEKATKAVDQQKAAYDRLLDTIRQIRLENQMAASGAFSLIEQENLNELSMLEGRRLLLMIQRDEIQRQINENLEISRQGEVDALNAQIAQNEATQEQLRLALETLRQQEAEKIAREFAKRAAEGLRGVMYDIAAMDLTGPFDDLIESIKEAVRQAQKLPMSTGNMNWATTQLGFTMRGQDLIPPESAFGDGGKSGGVKRQTQLRKEIELTKELTQAEKERQSIVQSVESSLENGFMSMIEGTESVKDAFKKMAAEIIKELYRVLVVQRMIGGISGSIGFLGGAITGTPSTGTLGLPKFATGGSMMPNRPYLVGEHGPELVIPRHSGTVVNANQTAGAMSGGGDITVQNNITVTGSDAAMVRAEVAKMIPQITNATKAAVIDAKQRGGQMAAAFR